MYAILAYAYLIGHYKQLFCQNCLLCVTILTMIGGTFCLMPTLNNIFKKFVMSIFTLRDEYRVLAYNPTRQQRFQYQNT